MFFLKSFRPRKTQVRFLRKNSTEQFSFNQETFKFLGGHGFNILIQKYFQRNENTFISLVLKAKPQFSCYKFFLNLLWISFDYFFIFLIYET